MKRIVLVLALVGCGGEMGGGGFGGAPGSPGSNPNSKAAANPMAGGGGGTGTGTGTGSGSGSGGTGSGSGSGSGLAIAGNYDVTTQFNLLDALPAEVKEALEMALAFTANPGGFVIDQVGKLPVLKYVVDVLNLFSGIREKMEMAINEYIDRWSQGMVSTMKGLSADVQAALKGLKAHNRLQLGAPDAAGNLAVKDTLLDLTFTYKGKDYAYPQAAKADLTGQRVGLKINLPAHTYDSGVNIGGLLVDLIDNVILPQLTGVNSLGALLNQLINCGGVGTHVWSWIANICVGDKCVIQYIGPNDISKLCVNALNAVGRALENAIEDLDAPGLMSMSDGSALVLEQRGTTGKADTVQDGTWALTLPIGFAQITLPGAFSGLAVP